MATTNQETNQSPSHTPTSPNSLLLAYAIQVVKSKPRELTVKAYITALQQHVAKGRRENRISSVYRHLDQSAFWRSEFQRVTGLYKTRDRELTLQKRKNDSLKRRVEELEAMTPGPATKKQRTADDTTSALRSQLGTEESQKRLDQDIEEALGVAGTAEAGEELLCCLYEMTTAIRQQGEMSNMDLARSLIDGASVISQVIQHSMTSKSAQLVKSGPDFLLVTLRVATRAASVFFLGVKALKATNDTDTARGQVIYAFANLFADIMGKIEQVLVPEDNKSHQTQLSNDQSQKNQTPNINENAVPTSLTNFIRGLIDLLDVNSDIHRELFEACAYVVLNKVGTQLYTSVFNHARGDNTEKEIMISNMSEGALDALRNAGLAKVNVQAPFLICLLKHIVAAAPAHLGTITDPKTGRPKAVTPKVPPKKVLTIVAKDRLQNTLLSSMFPKEGDDDKDPYKDCLKMPTFEGVRLSGSLKPKQMDTQDWFKEKVWTLLGWDILCRNGDT